MPNKSKLSRADVLKLVEEGFGDLMTGNEIQEAKKNGSLPVDFVIDEKSVLYRLFASGFNHYIVCDILCKECIRIRGKVIHCGTHKKGRRTKDDMAADKEIDMRDIEERFVHIWNQGSSKFFIVQSFFIVQNQGSSKFFIVQVCELKSDVFIPILQRCFPGFQREKHASLITRLQNSLPQSTKYDSSGRFSYLDWNGIMYDKDKTKKSQDLKTKENQKQEESEEKKSLSEKLLICKKLVIKVIIGMYRSIGSEMNHRVSASLMKELSGNTNDEETIQLVHNIQEEVLKCKVRNRRDNEYDVDVNVLLMYLEFMEKLIEVVPEDKTESQVKKLIEMTLENPAYCKTSVVSANLTEFFTSLGK